MVRMLGQVNDSPNDFLDEYIDTSESIPAYDLYYADEYMTIRQNATHHTFREKNNQFTIIFDGSIYNISELKSKLSERGVSFETGSDSEVLLNLYLLERENIVHHLRGMFSLAIWDKHHKTLFLARDPFGIKPLYYRKIEKGLLFASEQQILIFQGADDVSAPSLQHYLTFQYVPGGECLVKGIQQLRPGHYLIKEPGKKAQTYEYYHVSFQINADKPLETAIQQTREALEESVQKHMTGDQSIGAYLSGGVDSTSIVALARQYQSRLQTFTVGFEREGYSELDWAQETANKLGVENIQKVITPEEVIRELPHIVWYMDSPIADPAAIPNYFLAQETSKYVDVALSGEGADELFGGYKIYQEPQSLKLFNYIPNTLQRVLNWISRLLPEGVKGKSILWRGTTPLSQRYAGNAFIFNENQKRSLLHHYRDEHPFTEVTKPLFVNARDYDASTQMQYIDIHTWLNGDILTVADRMTNAHSLEMRVPFLDKEVFEIARTLPSNLKLAKGTTKYVLRQAVKDLLPAPVFQREKLGFPVPIRHWLRNELYEWAKNTIDNSPTEGLFDKQRVLELLEKHANDQRDYSRELWTILTFMVWYEEYMADSDVEMNERKQKMPIHS